MALGLSPMELWCNESQERYVIALEPGSVAAFAALCERERCPFAVVGEMLSYDPYGIAFRKDEPQLEELVDATLHQLAQDGEIERRYKRWFLRKLPSGVSLDLPMSAQLETLIQTMVPRSE